MILVVDLEATCADDGSISPEDMEIIEIGAVLVTDDGDATRTFQAFVRPVERPQLTPFCLTLTGIGQQDIDEADAFPSCATRLGAFARSHADQISSWGSWGAYDRKQLQRDSERHGIANPLAVLPHINGDNTITMFLQPSLSTIDIQGSGFRATTQTLTTTRIIKSGETMVLGGFITRQEALQIRKVPLLSDLPIIGNLFTQRTRASTGAEVLVFITPVIIEDYVQGTLGPNGGPGAPAPTP